MSAKHEPLCSMVDDPNHVDDRSECQCLLIEAVRNGTIIDCISAVYADCKHTKVLGCEPCTHDYTAGRLDSLLSEAAR